MAENKSPTPPDQHQRDLIVRELDRTMLVEAAAGTGKTTSMIARMVALLAAGKCDVDSLAAVTFTRKAAAEIRGRFQIELEKAVHESKGNQRARLQSALEHVERCFVGTIHSFCARILRERPVEANVDVAFQEVDERVDWGLRDQAWREHIETIVAADSPVVSELEYKGLKLWQRTRRDDPIVGELEELGLEVARMGPAFMSMAEFPDVDEWPAPEVPMPDLTEARTELRAYVDHIRELVPTLPRHPGNDELMPKYRLVARIMSYMDVNKPAELIEVLSHFVPTKVVQRNWPGGQPQGKAESVRWENFAQRHAIPTVRAWREHCYAPVLRAILPAKDFYDRLRRENNQLNFQDLLLKSAALLRDKPGIRKYFRRRFSHLLVDEFQDTDPIQAEVMLLLTADDPNETDWQKCRPVAGSLFVVGDPKQSIYRFRRADIITYTKVKRIIADAGGAIVPLSANFRTVEPLIHWINSTFKGRFPEQATPYSPENNPLQVGRGDDCGGEDDCGLRRLEVPSDFKTDDSVAQYEADLIARTIRQAIDSELQIPRSLKDRQAGVSPRARPEDFLILSRTKKRLAVYGQRLQQLGIPSQVTGGSTVNEVMELSLLHTCLRAVTRPDDQLALLAVLRSELFGISDTILYEFKRAGGTFLYHAGVPKELTSASRDAIAGAFNRLQQYARWMAKLPSISAIEKMAIDLGLWAHACTHIDGSLQAGSLGKAIEILRSGAHSGTATASDLVDQLGMIIRQDESHDGLPARPEPQAPVRVMTLHQAKGLEAPVVFLAFPTASPSYPPDFHIDRSSDRTRGYLMIQAESRGRQQRPTLAQPVGWEQLSAEEQQFLDAENDRLMYVAATRAGCQITISQRPSWKSKNPWQAFESQVAHCPIVEPPQSVLPPTSHAGSAAESAVAVAEADVSDAASEIAKKWGRVAAPTYAVIAAKQATLGESKAAKPHGLGEHGTEWGTVIHILLEAAMSQPGHDLRSLALSSVADQGLEANWVDGVIETVESVTQSDIWSRAQSGSKRLVEVPFETMLENAGNGAGATQTVPTIVRGVIDLAFREAAGWVIVDYKTEQVGKESLVELADYYRAQLEAYKTAWERMVGEPVHEMGIFFTHSGVYVKMGSAKMGSRQSAIGSREQ
jgi:ATP-dependent helicase/nuclease subunit A